MTNYESRMRAKADALRARGSAVILSVESSCDETAVAVVENGRIERANAIATQIDVHALYGGVVPEIASRMHVEAIDPLLDEALRQAGLTLDEIDAVAVTYGPGLVGALLTGVFNRLARSCFYGVAVKEGDEAGYRTGCIPAGEPTPEVMQASQQAALAFEQYMYKFETHHALSVCDEYLRAANKRWSDASKAAKNTQDDDAMTRALVNAFHELRVATILMHGIVPAGCELICEYFDIDPVAFFSWDHIFESTNHFIETLGEEAGKHAVKPLPPRFDFFAKHPSQY